MTRIPKQLNWRCRRATSSRRGLPDFVIIGAMKCGTSSLFHYLSQHPDLVSSLVKETHYFDTPMRYACGDSWYRAHFPLVSELQSGRLSYEATPRYLFDPLTPNRMHSLLPGAKLIAVLRNPTERAISHYFHEKQKKRETLPIEEALRAEESRLAPAVREENYCGAPFAYFSYKRRGHYREQLERYLNYYSSEQLLILSSKELFSTPHECLRRVFEFVGVDPDFRVKDLNPRNVSTNRQKVDPWVYEYLNSYFDEHNQRLYDLIGQKYDW